MRIVILIAICAITASCSKTPEQTQAEQRKARITQIKNDIDVKTAQAAERNRYSAPEPAAPAAPQPDQVTPEAKTNLAEVIRTGMKIQEKDAYYLARRTVQNALKAPGSAKFSALGADPDTAIVPYGFYQWQARGWVEAQNTFGAKLRQNWEAVVKFENGQMTVSWYKVGDQESGPKPAIAVAPGATVAQKK